MKLVSKIYLQKSELQAYDTVRKYSLKRTPLQIILKKQTTDIQKKQLLTGYYIRQDDDLL
ncbi:MAG: hypothetical protein LC117_10715 [Bacteroidia bacterium]|nr:hypothetical protein [Bacteroidia bacterium]